MPRSDRAWIEHLKRSGEAAHDEALSELRDYLKRTLSRGFGHQLSDGDIDDLTQESLLRITQDLDRFQERSRFTTWAASIAVHAAISELRRRRYRHVSIEDAAELGAAALIADDPTSRREDEERERALRRAIAEALTDRQRQAILALLGGLPLTEMARRLGTTQGAVYKLLHDARKRLRDYLKTAGIETTGALSAGGTG